MKGQNFLVWPVMGLWFIVVPQITFSQKTCDHKIWYSEEASITDISPIVMSTNTFKLSGPVSVLSGEGLLEKPENYFDLEGKMLRFIPSIDSGYTVEVLPVEFQADYGLKLLDEDVDGGWPAFGWKIDLLFNFPFAGQTWNSIFANLFGNISFERPEASYWLQRDPWSDGGMRSVAAAIDLRSVSGLENMIAVLWGNYPSGVSSVYANSTSDKLVITWAVMRDAVDYIPAGLNIFQAKLYPSGLVELAYEQVPEKDGFIGIFCGATTVGLKLDHVDDDAGDGPHPNVDIVSVDILDSGNMIRFLITMADEIPLTISSGELMHRVFLEYSNNKCEFGVTVRDAANAWSSCGSAPRTIGFQIEGKILDLFFPKALLGNTSQFSWKMDVVWWGFEGRFDGLDQWRNVNLNTLNTSEIDLSLAAGNFFGNTYEIFHYPDFPKQVEKSGSSKKELQ